MKVLAHPRILSGEAWVGYARRLRAGTLEQYPTIDYVGSRLRASTLGKLACNDKPLAALSGLPRMTAAWRWKKGAAFNRGPLPTGRTYFFFAEAIPSPRSPERNQISAAVVHAWIRVGSKSKAQELFDQELRTLHLIVIERDRPQIVRSTDYEDDSEGRAYFEQAQLDGIVVVVHSCARFPVFWVTASARQLHSTTSVEAHFFKSAETFDPEDLNMHNSKFWTPARRKSVVKSAREAIRAEGLKVTGIVDQRPCGLYDVPDEFVAAYDDAEESGQCLVLITEVELPNPM